jgi:AraC-like DNA-binding protein
LVQKTRWANAVSFCEPASGRKREKNDKAGKPLVHAALDSGFYDQSHFTNYFKYFVGITPKEYQQQCNIFQDFQQ